MATNCELRFFTEIVVAVVEIVVAVVEIVVVAVEGFFVVVLFTTARMVQSLPV